MFYFGYTSFREIKDIPENSFKVNVTARMWHFSFQYENGKQTDTLYVPVNTPIKLEMTSQDVNHAFFIPAFRIKEDVINGKKTYLGFTAKEIGDYDVACAEYCGLNHSAMYTKVKVLPKEQFDNWYNQKIEKSN
jgi:cytochrome c oxidase subunit 2